MGWIKNLVAHLIGAHPPPGEPADERDELYTLSAQLEPFVQRAAHPRDMLGVESFERAVELLRSRYPAQTLLAYAAGDNPIISCMALEALARSARDPIVPRSILAALTEYWYYPRYYALRALDAQARGALVVKVLTRVDWEWTQHPTVQFLRDFVARRVSGGEAVSVDALWRATDDERLELVEGIVAELEDVLPAGFAEELRLRKQSRLNLELLRGVGRIRSEVAEGDGAAFLVREVVAGPLADLRAAVIREPPRSALVVGNPGVGKTVLVDLLARELERDGWTVFVASPADVIAEQMFVGQLEGRVHELVRELSGKRAVWVIPQFQEALWAGRYHGNPRSLLDLLLPHVETGEIKVVGELPPAAYEQLVQSRPRARTSFQAVRLEPLSDADTLDLGRGWAQARRDEGLAVDEETLREALQLAKQYLTDREAPGNLFRLLEEARGRLEAEGGRRSLGRKELLVTLSELSGLPLSVLDERASLDAAELRSFFESRVLGQREAVDCLVERVAMIKAGVTDAGRPLGVFLFVGPTGTGKTQIAKALAEFLFGSPNRLVRLDMSELQTPESLARILGQPDDAGAGTALVNEVRRQPFSVVLLDEFEKAHPAVWDVFLQVFDDGRLTDRRGDTADFRHCVVIMTSNLGASVAARRGIGFSPQQATFTPAEAERTIARTFRPEFVNRIDRIVVFKPLSRETMRRILEQELEHAFQRRGLRTRSWAVEWDEAAIDFLLEKGFTAHLGARPLRRAVERYLLAPLAMTIVGRQAPEGDQFLFVTAVGDRLAVTFVDPDAGARAEEAPADAAAAEPLAAEMTVRDVALDGRGTELEAIFLRERFETLRDEIEGAEWQTRKREALAAMSEPGFWESRDRFAILGDAEYMDRLEAGLRTAGSLLERLGVSRANGKRRFPPELVQRLAQQLYLVETANAALDAGAPRDAFLSVRALDVGPDAEAFARRLGGMYKAWAAKRRMQLEALEESEQAPYRLVASVSGFGAYAILERDSGLHLFEQPPEEGRRPVRLRVEVRVAAQPDGPLDPSERLHDRAHRALAARRVDPAIVRRYRELPSPLVRDAAGWRTGKLGLVLGGDFDLVT